MADTLDFLRKDALRKRINGIVGGNRIAWAPKDIARIHGHIKSLSPEKIIRAAPEAVRKFEKRGEVDG
jgi:hypothetical protein